MHCCHLQGVTHQEQDAVNPHNGLKQPKIFYTEEPCGDNNKKEVDHSGNGFCQGKKSNIYDKSAFYHRLPAILERSLPIGSWQIDSSYPHNDVTVLQTDVEAGEIANEIRDVFEPWSASFSWHPNGPLPRSSIREKEIVFFCILPVPLSLAGRSTLDKDTDNLKKRAQRQDMEMESISSKDKDDSSPHDRP